MDDLLFSTTIGVVDGAVGAFVGVEVAAAGVPKVNPPLLLLFPLLPKLNPPDEVPPVVLVDGFAAPGAPKLNPPEGALDPAAAAGAAVDPNVNPPPDPAPDPNPVVAVLVLDPNVNPDDGAADPAAGAPKLKPDDPKAPPLVPLPVAPAPAPAVFLSPVKVGFSAVQARH